MELKMNISKEEYLRDYTDVDYLENKEKIEVANINCSSPVIDNNRINLVVTDGKKRLYCRAIIAAEFSAVMVPHVRFIVTENK